MRTFGLELVKRRHHLPHWRAGASSYHVAFKSKVFLPEAAREAVVKVIRAGEERVSTCIWR